MDNISYEIVSVSGGFWTGSGAVIDLLKESDNCIIVPTEFTLFTHGQLFKTLALAIETGNLRDYKAELREDIYRFRKFNKREVPKLYSALRYGLDKVNIYPKNLIVRRAGFGKYIGIKYLNACNNFINYVENIIQTDGEFSEALLMKSIIEIFDSIAEYYSKENAKSKFKLIFDQMIAPAYVDDFIKFIPEAQVVVVDRDWRDQYVEIRNEVKRMINTKLNLGVEANGLYLKTKHLDPIEFILEIRKLLLDQKKAFSRKSYLHWLEFESLIINYDSELTKIEKFLGININELEKGSRFKPEVSHKNIGKWKSSAYKNEVIKLEPLINKL